MSLSAVGARSAVVCSGYRGNCRRVVGIVAPQRLHGRLALTMQNKPPRKEFEPQSSQRKEVKEER